MQTEWQKVVIYILTEAMQQGMITTKLDNAGVLLVMTGSKTGEKRGEILCSVDSTVYTIL